MMCGDIRTYLNKYMCVFINIQRSVIVHGKTFYFHLCRQSSVGFGFGGLDDFFGGVAIMASISEKTAEFEL